MLNIFMINDMFTFHISPVSFLILNSCFKKKDYKITIEEFKPRFKHKYIISIDDNYYVRKINNINKKSDVILNMKSKQDLIKTFCRYVLCGKIKIENIRNKNSFLLIFDLE